MARPKREFTDEEVQEIERLARINCKTQTIADALGIPYNTLKRSFGRRMTNWRALGRCKLRANQDKLSEVSADMAKFLGINVLGQQIKQVIETVPPDSKPKTGQELEAAKASARAYNEVMSKTNIIPIKEAKSV